MPEIAVPLLTLLVYLALYIWAIACICRFGWSGLRDVISEFSCFSVGGFSIRRLAWFLAIINGLLTPLHWWADWRGDERVAVAAILLSLAIVVSCLFTLGSSRGRFMPVAFSAFFTINHFLLCKA